MEPETMEPELATLIDQFLAVTDRGNGAALIAAKPAEAIFKPKELEILQQELARVSATAPPTQKDATIVLKATRLCNLRCTYCNSWGEGPGHVISFRSLLRRTLESLRSAATDSVEFVWHGGEVTLINPAIIEKMLWVQQHYKPASLIVNNSLQTNALDISDEWLSFLERTPISVGVSIDGPAEIQNASRRTKEGDDSYAAVIDTLSNLHERGISFGALIVVGRATLEMPMADYLDWLIANKLFYVDFLNVAPGYSNLEDDVRDQEFVPVDEFVQWLARVFDHIYSESRWSAIRVRFIEDIIAGVRERRSPASCYFSGECFSNVLTVNPSGSLRPCDKYVTNADSKMEKSFGVHMSDAVVQLGSLRNSYGSQLWVERGRCKWHHLCKGGCPHDSQALSVRNGGTVQCCGFAPLFERAEAHVVASRLATA